jgi:galactan endo-1,6-beta-galactosidase
MTNDTTVHFGSALRILAGLVLAAAVARADYTVQVDTGRTRGVWEGWGCSLSWWGNGIGGGAYEDVHADLYFTTQTVWYAGEQLPGLGFTIVRYNIGGGGNNDSPEEKTSDKLPWFRDIDGFWIDGRSRDPASPSWDWSRDARQRSALKAVQARGVRWIEFFANAPMWWMTDSRSSAGGKLLNERVADFAYYLATVAQRARTHWGVPVHFIQPFNEPTAWWWTYPKNQEGCTIPKEQQRAVIDELARELARQRNFQTKITASDENSMDVAIDTWRYFEKQGTARHVAKVNVHSYIGIKPWRDNAKRTELRQVLGTNRLWMSEFCTGEDGGLDLFRILLDDLTYCRPTAWLYWMAVEPEWNWTFTSAAYGEGPDMADRGKPLKVFPKHFLFAQFSRFLTPGMVVLNQSDTNSVVGYHPQRGELALITANFGPSQTISYDLSAFEVGATNAAVTCSSFDGRKRFEAGSIPLEGTTLLLRAETGTVYSTVIRGVEPRSSKPASGGR